MKPNHKLLLPALILIALLATIMSYQSNQDNEDTPPDAESTDASQQSSITSDQRTITTIAQPSQQPTLSTAEPQSDNNPPGNTANTSITTAANSNPTDAQADVAQPVLSDRVFFVIEEAQKRQQAGQFQEALIELNALYTDFDSMNPFEQATLLNFYTNILLRLEMWQESIAAFSLMLTLDDLRPDINARALLALGQLHTQANDIDAATAYYNEWLDFTRDMDGLEAQTERVKQQLNNFAQL